MLEQLRKFLQNSGYSVTKPRQAVFVALDEAGPITMDQLIETLSTHVNRASVYRTVDLFEKLGVIQRIQIGWKYKIELSNAFQAHHHHITCMRCGMIVPFQERADLNTALDVLAFEYGFTVTNHMIELQGYCAKCKQNISET